MPIIQFVVWAVAAVVASVVLQPAAAAAAAEAGQAGQAGWCGRSVKKKLNALLVGELVERDLQLAGRAQEFEAFHVVQLLRRRGEEQQQQRQW